MARPTRRPSPHDHRTRPSRPAFRPRLEPLEERLTPSLSFANAVNLAAADHPTFVTAADLNGDGRPDLVAANYYGDNSVSVSLNTTPAGATAPSFAAAVTFAVGNTPLSVAAADFNGDGKPDLVVANSNPGGVGSGDVSVLLNTTAPGASAPSFAAQVTVAIGHFPVSVAVGDFNGDGKPDFAVASYDTNTVQVVLDTTPAGATAPSFAVPVGYIVDPGPQSLAVGDFNGDGKPDLAVACNGDGSAALLLNSTAAGAAAPAFAMPVTFNVGSAVDSVAAADFNGDGRPDLAFVNNIATGNGTATVLLNTAAAGATTPLFTTLKTFTVGGNPFAVAAADFDGDGRPDLVVDNYNSNGVSVLLDTTPAGTTTPTFAAQQGFFTGFNDRSVVAADFNGDGRPDVAVADYINSAVPVLLNTTTPFAATEPAVVADVPGQGVMEYSQATGAWAQLNPSDVSLLAADAQGDVFADYPGYGVYRYVPSLASWHLLNGQDAEALAVDAAGDVFLSIAGAGVGLFRRDGSGQLLTPSAAALLSSDANGDLVGEFPGYGVYRRTAFEGVWRLVNGTDAQAVAIDGAGDVFASFTGAGTAVFRRDGSAQLLTPAAAALLSADAGGDLAAVFAGYGVYRRGASASSFTLLNGTTPTAVALDASGDVFASFAGAGTAEFRLYGGGAPVNPSAASLLAADPFGD